MKFSIFGAIVLLASGQSAFAAPADAPATAIATAVSTTSATPSASSSTAATTTKSNYIPQFSPVFPGLTTPTDVVTSYNYGPYNTSEALTRSKLDGYPDTLQIPDPKHPEVQAIVKMIDWSKVPKAPVRKQKKSGGWVSDTDGPKDPYCWWSDTLCLKPKINIPADFHECPTKGDWGLSYDDGPFNPITGEGADVENPWAEPRLYNYLEGQNNQKATLFYIGSNVATYPEAAKRAFNDGHSICVHTWSHPPMTTVTNEEAVAEFYWTLKAIKETTGVTPKCWRPPQGDVDDRIRSIAWQMGMQTVIWDWDTNDWNMPALGGGDLPPSTVDGYFKTWIKDQKDGKEKTGHIVLEHELNHMTVNMSMKWLPTLQEVFNVLPAMACNNVSQPYWETNMVYPLTNVPAQN